ncbi:MAG: hypothetical protein QOE82_3777 [Thermoanaerobaculia bacterium]|jgi:hypothetical protein|nr:hypothetical protein [Thermoanaerobaculia bacterium]
MDVRIGTLTSRVTVSDGAAVGPELIETVVAIVLQRIREERASHESAEREQSVRHHMTEPSRY